MKITPQIEKHLKANMNLRKRDIIIANFLGGMAWGFGTIVGATVVVAIIVAILNALGVFDWINAVIDFFNQFNQDADSLYS